MPITLTINYTNGAAKTLAVLEGHVKNLTPALTATKELVTESVRQNFVAGGRPVPWAPLKHPRRVGSLGSAVPLTDTGRLRASITGQVTGASVLVGTNLPYAALHQFGGIVNVPAREARPGHAFRWVSNTGEVIFRRRTRAHTVRIPARPYLLLQPQDVTAILGLFEQHVTRGSV